MDRIFVTGIGTDVGKTLVAAILCEALGAGYWKPVQAGWADGKDSQWVQEMLGDPDGRIHPEAYRLALPASPHIAAREEGLRIDLGEIMNRFCLLPSPLVVEGAGGLMVPLNDMEFVSDLARKMDIPVILVSRNYLGSINHSLLTAQACRVAGLRVAGWIFNDQYMDYAGEIAQWSGIPVIASIPRTARPDRVFVRDQAARLLPLLRKAAVFDV